MFKVRLDKNGKFFLEGNFCVGNLGLYTEQNSDIELNSEFIKKIKVFNLEAKSENEKINHYYLKIQEKILNNIKEIENRFLIFLFNDYFGSGNSFWADEETNELCCFIIKDKMPKLEDDENYSDYIYATKLFTNKSYNNLYQGKSVFDDDIDDYLNNLDIDMKKYISKYFPMIDYKLFIESLTGDFFSFNDDKFSFEISNPECGYCSVCAAYFIMTEDFKIKEWHHR